MLAEIQRQFINHVLSPDLVSGDNLSIPKSLLIYRNNTVAALKGVLQDTYPAIVKLVGEQFFNRLAQDYIFANLPRTFNLNEYGGNLSQFINSYSACGSLKYLPAVAVLEWYLHTSFIDENPKTFNKEEFAKVGQDSLEQVSFQILANARLLHSKYPVDKIWQFNQEEQPVDATLELSIADNYLIIYTRNGSSYIDRLQSHEYLFAKMLQEKLPFSKICDKLLEQHTFSEVVAILSKFINLGYIDSFKLYSP